VKRYRLIETAPLDGTRRGKRGRTAIWTGPDTAGLKAAIDEWCAGPHKPWSQISYYHGSKRIYAYEL
jgi:hypothetical protein